jgi:hypothetical protein
MKNVKIPLLSYFKADAPAVGKAAAAAAIAQAESDPKVEAVTAASALLLEAAQNLKAAVNEHPDAPDILPAPESE